MNKELEENNQRRDSPLERFVIPHKFGENEGGYRQCKVCGTTEHKKPFNGYLYWLASIGYESDIGCRE